MADAPEKKGPESFEIPDIRTLTILYTNDIQGAAQQMAYLATVARQVRAAENYTLLLDSGNWAKGTLISDQFKGMPMVEIFSALEYDAVGIGEGEIKFGSNNLYILEEKASFPFVCCNLIEEGSNIAPYFLKNYITLEKGPFKIAITGVTAKGDYERTGFEVKDPFTSLPDVMEEIKGFEPDVIILLSNLGIERDKAVARAFPDVNVIIGGGDLKFLEEPIREGKTMICQAGEKAEYLGSLALDMETTIKITSME